MFERALLWSIWDQPVTAVCLTEAAAAAAEKIFVSGVQHGPVTNEIIETLSRMTEANDPWNVAEPALWL